MSNRDNFTKPTIDILAKRVGFLCSNPTCRKHTIGPNSVEEKFTLIGIAAHITAAAPGGPRYDEELSEEERRHIRNGIWLCSNCATLIDKDAKAFPTELLYSWKYKAELEMRNAIAGRALSDPPQQLNPFIEADLIWSSGGRYNRGYSPKNFELYGNEPILVGSPIIVFWELDWTYSFVLHNNSSFPAFNIKVVSDSEVGFSSITKLPDKNNLPPFTNLDLQAKTQSFIESVHTEADELMHERIPRHIEGLKLRITYLDESRAEHETLVEIKNGEVLNHKIK